LGKNRRRVRFLAWDTLLPVVGPLPVTWQTLDIILTSERLNQLTGDTSCASEQKGPPLYQWIGQCSTNPVSYSD
jgi:hypothetical protein